MEQPRPEIRFQLRQAFADDARRGLRKVGNSRKIAPLVDIDEQLEIVDGSEHGWLICRDMEQMIFQSMHLFQL